MDPSTPIPSRSAERSEPLQNLSSQHNSRHRSVNNNDIDKKKRRRRRRRRAPKMQGTSANLSGSDVPVGEPTTSCENLKNKKHQSNSRARTTGKPTLRPVGTQVPRAPENSTQFIMDDHENSSLFVNFDNYSSPHWEKEQEELAEDHNDHYTMATPSGTPSGTPTHRLTREWFPFNLNDFEAAYQTAREDKLMGGSRSDLRSAIISLEARAAVLTEALSASPSRLLSNLQAQLLHLQEENVALRARITHRKNNPPSSSSSSTNTDSDTDSTDSSSDCSESDCDTCAARRKPSPASDEEKENTCPSVSTTTHNGHANHSGNHR